MKLKSLAAICPLIAAVLIGLAFSCPSFAQSAVNLSFSSGGASALALNVTGTAPAAMQWTLSYPTNQVSGVSVTAGPAATAAGKSVQCMAGSGSYSCVLSGMNSNTLASGTVANVTITSSTGAPAITIRSAATSADGSSLAVTSSVSGIGGGSAPPVTVSSLTCSPLTLNSGTSANCSVALSGAAPAGGIAVAITSSSSLLTAPAAVTVAAGSTSGSFSAQAATIATSQGATITASAGGASSTASFSLVAATTPPPTTPPGTTLPTMAAAYAFDEGGGSTVSDTSGNGSTGQIQGATWTANGKYGKALSFNGTAYVDLGSPASLQNTGSMTWSAWVFATGNPSDDGQIAARSDNSNGWQFKTSPDTGRRTFAVGVSPDGSSLTQRYSNTALSLNTWYHVAGVYNSSARTLDIYVNGALDDGVLKGAVPASQFVPALNTLIGARSGGFNFMGVIDNLRIYNRALAASDIQTDMYTPVASAGSGVSGLPAVSSLKCSPTTLTSGATCQCTVGLSQAPSANTSISLSSASSLVTLPASVTVGAGSASGSFNAQAVTITANQSAGLTASYNGTSATASLALQAPSTSAGLVAAYAFGEGNGSSVADSSGNGNTGTIANATWTTAGKYGNALMFNGVYAWVTVNDAAPLHLTSAMTLEAWVNPSTVNAAWRDVIYKGNDNYYLSATSASQSGSPAGGGAFGSITELYGTAALATNVWAHLAVTYDGSALRLYVNGVQVSSVAQTGSLATSGNPLQIGGDSFFGQFFNGIIDEVRVYNRALSAAEIQTDMYAPIAVSTAPAPPAPPAPPPPAPPAPPATPATLSSVSCAAKSLSSGGSTTCTITLSGPAPAGGAIILVFDNTSMLTTQQIMTVPAGSATTTFTASAGDVFSSWNAVITAYYSGALVTTSLRLLP